MSLTSGFPPITLSPEQKTLSQVARFVKNPDTLIRAGKLLVPVVDFLAASRSTDLLSAFLAGLDSEGDDVVAPFLSAVGGDREVSSWYLSAVGRLLGHRALPGKAVQMSDADATGNATAGPLRDSKLRYISLLADTISSVTADCAADTHADADAAAHGVGAPVVATAVGGARTANATSTAAAVALQDGAGGEASVLQAASSTLGYIPTVPGIGGAQALSLGDEQLGRVLSGLSAFLSTDENRVLFCGGGAPAMLAALLDKEVDAPVQVYYHTVFCLWLLSFVARQRDADSAAVVTVADALEKAAVPRRLTAVLREVSSEKVVRVSLATLRNLLGMSATLRKEMVGAGLVDALQSPTFRRLDDDDIRDDLGTLATALEEELSHMSSFDVYKAEVLSGALEWTPAHRDEQFWRDNVEKLERNQQEVMRCMVRLLHQSSDGTVLAVACNDLAQFIKFHPRGRSIVQSFGVKARLMELMVSGEGEVRRYALNCAQVLMIRWKGQGASS